MNDPFDNGDYLDSGFEDSDPINSPAHYTYGDIEVIDAIESWGLCYHDGNVVKYVARAKHKGKELQDLKKAAWYLNRRIMLLEEACEDDSVGYDNPMPIESLESFDEMGSFGGDFLEQLIVDLRQKLDDPGLTNAAREKGLEILTAIGAALEMKDTAA